MENPIVQIPALDLRHLSSQTLGDTALQRQLLTLFRTQALRIVSSLQNTAFTSDQINADLAHLLKGSALAIGATRVAAMAAAYENLVAAPNRVSAAITLQALVEAVTEAIAAIDGYIGPF